MALDVEHAAIIAVVVMTEVPAVEEMVSFQPEYIDFQMDDL